MDQASLLDGVALDACAVEQDGLAASEIDVGRGQVVQDLVAAVMIVVVSSLDLRLEIARQVVVLEQNAVVQGLMPTLDLALDLGVAGGRRLGRQAARVGECSAQARRADRGDR